ARRVSVLVSKTDKSRERLDSSVDFERFGIKTNLRKRARSAQASPHNVRRTLVAAEVQPASGKKRREIDALIFSPHASKPVTCVVAAWPSFAKQVERDQPLPHVPTGTEFPVALGGVQPVFRDQEYDHPAGA